MAPSRLERLKRELDSAISEGDLELALDVTTDMVDLDPKSPIHHTSRGVVLAKLNRLEEALKELDRAIDIDPEDPKAWYSKGCILMDNGRPRPALACFYKALDVDPAQERARNRFNRCLDMMAARKETLKEEEILHEGPTLIREESEMTTLFPGKMQGADEKRPLEREAGEMERPPLPVEEPELPRTRRRGGSLLDEDMFEDEEEEGEEEEWEEAEEEELESWEGEEAEEEEWEESGEEESEQWDEDMDEEDFEEVADWGEDEHEVLGTITCRCGADIPVYSEERPYRFRCPECGRTGTLK